MIYFFLLLISITVFAEDDCPPDQLEAISSLTSLSVPNCIDLDGITAEVENSLALQSRQRRGLPPVTTPQAICQNCQERFRSLLPSLPSIVEKKKDAFFQASYKELEKSLSSIVVDTVGLRKTWSTSSGYSASVQACDTKKIEKELSSCRSPFLNSFKSKNLTDRIANEVASLVSINQNGLTGILDRSGINGSCNISDEIVMNLKPRLFEEMITPEIVRAISNIRGSTPLELQTNLHTALNGKYGIFEKHPILKELMKEPSLFLSTFRSMQNVTDIEILKRNFRAAIYSPEMGSLIDRKNAEKCSQTISNFTKSLCSKEAKEGTVACGPFSNFKKLLDNDQVEQAAATTSDALLANNLLMFEFCSTPPSNSLNLKSLLDSMNSWMLFEDRESNLSEYSSIKYNRDFGDTKNSICSYLPATDCDSQDGEQCSLYKLYRKSLDSNSSEGRLAGSPDRNANRVLQALIGNSDSISGRSREVLIAEGILPQSNGRFVERPEIPERQPEYLAGVANGTITPNVSSSSAVQSQASRSSNRNSQAQAQPQLSQPTQGNSAVNETQIAANDEDDAEGLKRFEQGLADRLRNANGQPSAGASRNAQLGRRQVSRPDSSGRFPNSNQPSAIIPSPLTDASSQISDSSAVASTELPEARLGQDTSRRGLADRQRNDALANMNGAKTNPSATPEADRSPASEEATFRPEASLTINIESSANLERVLFSNENLRALIQEQKPFRFKLNNNVFDVQFKDGNYTVSFRSGANNGRTVASTLQGIFNNSLRRSPSADRNATLQNLGNTLRN